jgi:O-antigen/teichoic acid export membrane protein
MGAPAVAIYAIPLKFVELIEIPLRSFTATAFPKLSAALQQGSQQFVKVLSMYLAYSFLLLAPAIIVLLAAPMFFLQILGGSEYADSIILQRNILYLVLLYILLLPFDRYSGMALFALNKPELNFYKIVFMLFTNILFDLIAVFVFNSLQMVAMATVIFTFFGIILGWWYIYKNIGQAYKTIFPLFIENILYIYLSFLGIIKTKLRR